jgi:hypothetical protein
MYFTIFLKLGDLVYPYPSFKNKNRGSLTVHSKDELFHFCFKKKTISFWNVFRRRKAKISCRPAVLTGRAGEPDDDASCFSEKEHARHCAAGTHPVPLVGTYRAMCVTWQSGPILFPSVCPPSLSTRFLNSSTLPRFLL